MAVLCAKCGEELLGAINRCWRCGTEYESRSGDTQVPPRRRSPIVGGLLGEALEAIVEDAPTTDNDERHSESPEFPQGLRRGSPFRPAEPAETDTESMVGAPPRATRYPVNNAATVGATLAMTLGTLSLGLCYFYPLVGGIMAAVGIGMGVWGLHSKQRKGAIFGLLLCCAALAIAGFFGAAEVFRAVHGHAPWESEIPGF